MQINYYLFMESNNLYSEMKANIVSFLLSSSMFLFGFSRSFLYIYFSHTKKHDIPDGVTLLNKIKYYL